MVLPLWCSRVTGGLRCSRVSRYPRLAPLQPWVFIPFTGLTVNSNRELTVATT